MLPTLFASVLAVAIRDGLGIQVNRPWAGDGDCGIPRVNGSGVYAVGGIRFFAQDVDTIEVYSAHMIVTLLDSF